MWFDPGLAGLFITSTLLHLGEDINLLVVSTALNMCSIKAGSENGFDPATGSTGGGILSPPVYLIHRA